VEGARREEAFYCLEVAGVFVGIDYLRRRMVLPAEGFGPKALGGCCVAFGRE
jgi:hypothetical protein